MMMKQKMYTRSTPGLLSDGHRRAAARGSWCLVLMVVVAAAVMAASAADVPQCVEWLGEPKVCQGYPGLEKGMMMYVPPRWTPDWIVGNCSATARSTVNAAVTEVSELCFKYAMAGVCGSWIRPCASVSPPFPKQPCENVCKNLIDSCRPLTDPVGISYLLGAGGYTPYPYTIPIIPCSMWEEYNATTRIQFYVGTPDNATIGLPDNYGLNWTNTTLIVPDECGDMGNAPLPYSSPCEYPMVPSDLNSQCVLPCPLPSLTDDQYALANDVYVSIAMVSLSVVTLTLFLYVTNARMRRPRKNNLIAVLLFLLPALIGMVMPLFAGSRERVWCGQDDYKFEKLQVATYDPVGNAYNIYLRLEETILRSSPCRAQGFFIYLGLMLSVIMWMFVCFDVMFGLLSYNLLNRKSRVFRSRFQWAKNIAYWSVSVVLAFLMAIIIAARDRFGYSYGGTFCFITDEDDGYYLIFLFFVPTGVCIVISVACYLVSSHRVASMLCFIYDVRPFYACMSVAALAKRAFFCCMAPFVTGVYRTRATDRDSGEEGAADREEKGSDGDDDDVPDKDRGRGDVKDEKGSVIRHPNGDGEQDEEEGDDSPTAVRDHADKRVHLNKTAAGKQVLQRIVRPTMFVAAVAIVFLWTYFYFIYKFARRDEAQRQTTEFFTLVFAGIGINSDKTPEFNSDSVAYGPLVVCGAFISGIGILVCFVMLTDPDLWEPVKMYLFRRLAANPREPHKAVLYYFSGRWICNERSAGSTTTQGDDITLSVLDPMEQEAGRRTAGHTGGRTRSLSDAMSEPGGGGGGSSSSSSSSSVEGSASPRDAGRTSARGNPRPRPHSPASDQRKGRSAAAQKSAAGDETTGTSDDEGADVTSDSDYDADDRLGADPDAIDVGGTVSKPVELLHQQRNPSLRTASEYSQSDGVGKGRRDTLDAARSANDSSPSASD